MAEVLWLDEVGDADRPRVGAKAFHLARLRRHGLPVPDGFVLVPGAGRLDEAAREALLAAYRRLGGAVAVRSSSTSEDTDEASFAGQYVTVLDVRDAEAVAVAAGACLESASAARGYARALGAAGGSMAVLVQRFVEPRAAGVAFTRDPRTPGSVLVVIEAHAGRGEAVVSGRVSPERYVLDREGLVREAPEGGSLDADSARQIARLALRAEELFGAPQDVEWACGLEGVVILQSRPITVEAEEGLDPRLRRLTRANVGEVLPDPVTPLTWTTVGAFLEHGFKAVGAALGLLSKDAPPTLVLYRQRLYLNLSLVLDVASRLPGLTSHAEPLVLGGGAGRGATRAAGGRLPVLLKAAKGVLRLAVRLPGEIDSVAAAIGSLPPSAAIEDRSCIARRLEELVPLGQEVASCHIACSGASAFHLALLARVLKTLTPGDPTERVNRLVSGLDDVESVSPALALEALAEEAKRRKDWASWLSRPEGDVVADWKRGEVPPPLAAALRRFLDRFGHRGLSEGELRAKVWGDDPTPIFAALLALLASPRSAQFGRRARAAARAAEEEALFARRGPLGAALLRGALAGAQRWVKRREETKSLTIRLVAHARGLARAAARTLVASGTLRAEDDVYFLTHRELLAALNGAAVPAAALEKRRRRHEREATVTAPREVDLARETVAGPTREAGRGLGVSPGIGRGRARVLLPGEGPRLEPGEVLVAPVLDAALGPLLATAAAAVAEIGGMLSHGSVVARELGVPCVVDLHDATGSIRTGDLVLVDGGTGRVEIEMSGDSPRTQPPATSPPSFLPADDPADEAFHPLENDPRARESVYFNLQDPEAGIAIVSSLGLRPSSRGECLLAIALPDGRVLFGLDRQGARVEEGGISVAGLRASWRPVGLHARTVLASHELPSFPPSPLALLLNPRVMPVEIDLAFHPATPAVDLCAGLTDDQRRSLHPLGSHHVEQSGDWRGELVVDGRRIAFAGTGSRDHTWGLRDWAVVDYWRLFTLRLGEDLALHALVVGVEGRVVEGGFVLRGGRVERITRVEYASEGDRGRLRSVELHVSTVLGPPLRVIGEVWRTITVPVQVERRPRRHLAGRPYRLLLHENYTRYEGADLTGFGMAEFTSRA